MEEASGHVGIFPDNLDAVDVFITMDTQWSVGFSGRTGLDYSKLPFVMRMAGIERKEWPRIFDSVRVMERAALEHLNKK